MYESLMRRVKNRMAPGARPDQRLQPVGKTIFCSWSTLTSTWGTTFEELPDSPVRATIPNPVPLAYRTLGNYGNAVTNLTGYRAQEVLRRI